MFTQSNAFAISILSDAIPSYIADLSPFEVRRLEGAYAPTNGNTVLNDAVSDPRWFDHGGINHVTSITRAWSGGATDRRTRRLFVHGGGHGDGGYNGLLQFDFSGEAAPIGWSEVPGSLSDIDAIAPLPTGGNASDGRPGAVHSYDGLAFDPDTDRILRVGGSLWSGSGGLTHDVWAFDLRASRWEALSPSGLGGIHTPSTVMHSEMRRVLHINDCSGSGRAEFLNLETEAWSAAVDVAPFSYSHTTVWDPVRNQVLVVRDGPASLIVDIDWERMTLATTTFSAVGDAGVLNTEGMAMWFDVARDSIWCFGGRANSLETIWEITNLGDPGHRFTATAYPLSGPALSTTEKGLYSRFAFFPDWRAVGVCERTDEPTSIIRLP